MLTRCPSMALSWPCGTLAFQSSNYHKLVGKCYLALVRGQRNYGRMSPESQAGGVAVCPPSVLFWIMIDFSCRSLYHCLTSSYSLTLLISTPFSFELPSFTSSTPSIFFSTPLHPPSLHLPPSSLFTTNISSKHNNRGHQPVARRQLQEQQRCRAADRVCVCVCKCSWVWWSPCRRKKQTNKQRRNKCFSEVSAFGLRYDFKMYWLRK